jgi:hypothetical protein
VAARAPTLARIIAFVAAAAALAWGSWLAYHGELPLWIERVPHGDKVLHFACFGLAAALLDRVLRGRDVFHRPPIPLAAAIVLGASGVDEVLQSLSAIRTCSFADYGANVLGVYSFLRVSRAFVRLRRSPPRPS